MTYREMEKLILKDGWMVTRQRGSHRQYKHPEKKRTRDHRPPTAGQTKSLREPPTASLNRQG